MPATEAQIAANRANARKSTGPKTPEGKEASRANAYKHGLTGTGVVLAQKEAAEVERRVGVFCAELAPSGGVGQVLVRIAATMSVRAERCVEHENALLTERVRQAEADFVAPEGCPEAEATQLRMHAIRLALFDPSKEANLARKYGAAAERSFFKALKELRTVERRIKEIKEEWVEEKLASILPGKRHEEEFDPIDFDEIATSLPREFARPDPVDFGALGGRFDVPMAIGKRR